MARRRQFTAVSWLFRWLLRGVLWVAGAWALAALVSIPLGGVWVPPVLKENGPVEFAMDGLGYPQDASLCSCETTDGLSLRGVFVPSDRGAPIVVHLAESGGSSMDGAFFRRQYEGLAHVGFASLALDYRGVGASEGERAPSKLGEDAAAIYAYAKGLVGGDESRLLLRGCSVGTVAAASLLAGGARPGAVIAWAPVEARSVARRFAGEGGWGRLTWLANPFLRSFESARTLDQLLKAPCPVFVAASPSDPLLDGMELAKVRSASEEGRLVLYVPGRMAEGPGPAGLSRHAALAAKSFGIGREETAFLHGAFASEPAAAQRANELLAAVDLTSLGDLAQEPRFRQRLESVAALRRDLMPEAAVAAAAVLPTSSFAGLLKGQAKVCSEGWFKRGPFYRPAAEEAAFGSGDGSFRLDQMLAVFEADVDDEDQGLMLAAADSARRTLLLARTSDGGLLWTPARLLALVRAFRGDASDPLVFEGVEAKSALLPGPFAGITLTRTHEAADPSGVTVHLVLLADGRRSTLPLRPHWVLEALGLPMVHLDAEEERLLLRCLLRATWHSHEVRPDPDGDWELVEQRRQGPR